jgi:cytoskeletal protein CcmA (bactofilin family)
VSQSLILRSTGKVVGVIHYTEIEIEKGGLVEGKLTQQSLPGNNPPAPPVVISSPEPKDSTPEEES